MIGIFNRECSWELQSVWNLDNGAVITVEFNRTYGDMVSLIEFNGVRWHCSDGLAAIPEFARDWIEVVVESADTRLARPKFEKKYEGEK